MMQYVYKFINIIQSDKELELMVVLKIQCQYWLHAADIL